MLRKSNSFSARQEQTLGGLGISVDHPSTERYLGNIADWLYGKLKVSWEGKKRLGIKKTKAAHFIKSNTIVHLTKRNHFKYI